MEYQVVAAIPKDADAMLRAYLECAEWCGLTEEEDREALELSVRPHWSDEAIARAREDCADFYLANEADIDGDVIRAGHDFWLTRNRHGAGFWDGYWHPEAGERMTANAHAYGEAYVEFDADHEELYFV